MLQLIKIHDVTISNLFCGIVRLCLLEHCVKKLNVCYVTVVVRCLFGCRLVVRVC